MFDIFGEGPVPLAAATKLIPPGRSGKATAISTLVRWITTGAKDLHGQRVRLEAVRVGDRWMTSRPALERFIERLTPRFEDSEPAPAPRTMTQRQRAAERAAKELEAAGI